jgi:hypothetical protein
MAPCKLCSRRSHHGLGLTAPSARPTRTPPTRTSPTHLTRPWPAPPVAAPSPTGIYFVFGDNFLHGGRVGGGPPPYVDPEALLSEPTVDRFVPYNSSPYAAPDLR